MAESRAWHCAGASRHGSARCCSQTMLHASQPCSATQRGSASSRTGMCSLPLHTGWQGCSVAAVAPLPHHQRDAVPQVCIAMSDDLHCLAQATAAARQQCRGWEPPAGGAELPAGGCTSCGRCCLQGAPAVLCNYPESWHALQHAARWQHRAMPSHCNAGDRQLIRQCAQGGGSAGCALSAFSESSRAMQARCLLAQRDALALCCR